MRWARSTRSVVVGLPAERTKNGLAHEVPLSAAALALLPSRDRGGREFVFGRGPARFPGWSPE
jgi:hypothetical protein